MIYMCFRHVIILYGKTAYNTDWEQTRDRPPFWSRRCGKGAGPPAGGSHILAGENRYVFNKNSPPISFDANEVGHGVYIYP